MKPRLFFTENVPHKINVGNTETSKLERTETSLFSQNALVTKNMATGTNIPHRRGTKNK